MALRNPFKKQKLSSSFKGVTFSPVDSQESAIHRIQKMNSIVSENLGIGIINNDIIEDITVLDRQYHGTEARQWYRGLDYVKRIIDSPAEEALRAGFDVVTNFENYGLSELYEERLKELDFHEKATQWLINSRLYSRGGLLYPVIREHVMHQDRRHLQQPLELRNVEKVLDINLPPEDFFHYHVQQYDPLALGFGDVESLNVSGSNLHPSRYHLWVNSLDIYRQRGISILDQILVACKAINVAEWTISQLIARYRSLLVKYPAKEIAGENKKRKDRLWQLLNDIKTKFTTKSVASVPDNYQFEYLQTTLAGINEGTDFLFEYLSGVSRIPQSIIKGTAKGELASSEKDQRDYYELVQAVEQERKLKPMMENFLFPMLTFERSGKIWQTIQTYGIPLDELRVSVEFKPMQSINPFQDSQKKLVDSQRASVDIQNGMRNPQEARKELYPDLEDFAPSVNAEIMPQDPFSGDFFGGLELPGIIDNGARKN